MWVHKCFHLFHPVIYFNSKINNTIVHYSTTFLKSLFSKNKWAHLFHVCSKGFPLFHRCIPVDVDCYTQFAQAFVTFVSDNSVLRRVIAGVTASKEIIMGLCVFALGNTHGYISPAVYMRMCLCLFFFCFLLFPMHSCNCSRGFSRNCRKEGIFNRKCLSDCIHFVHWSLAHRH